MSAIVEARGLVREYGPEGDGAERTALGRGAASEDGQAPMRAAGWLTPAATARGGHGAAELCAQSGNPRFSVLDGPKQ